MELHNSGKIQCFFLNSNNIERESYIWNMAGSMLMAFQSVIMLMILTRVLGLIEAGIFTIAYANANLFLAIGKYGVRYFQVSDIKGNFSFNEYLMVRKITTFAMLVVSFGYTYFISITNFYSVEKLGVIIWMCLFKSVDSIEDVYLGFYQQKNRLDVSSKILTVRMFITICIFGIGLLFSRNLLISLIIATLSTIIICIYFIKITYPSFKTAENIHQKGHIKKLLWQCFPLFAGMFLSYYIGNAPKYAIDANLNDELQACYGFIAMPVFVIGLFNNFIFNPMIYQLSILWNEHKIRKFVIKIIRQIGIVILITFVCILGAYIIGIPVLSWLYNSDLSPYRTELIILLIGGGFLGMSGLLNTVITIMRYQNTVVWAYGFVAIIAMILSTPVVKKFMIIGAAALYTVLMFILCSFFIGIIIYGILKELSKYKKLKTL